MAHKGRPKARRWQTTIGDRVLGEAVAKARGVARASARGAVKGWGEVKDAG